MSSINTPKLAAAAHPFPSFPSPQAGYQILRQQRAGRNVVQRVVIWHDHNHQAIQRLAQLAAQPLQGQEMGKAGWAGLTGR